MLTQAGSSIESYSGGHPAKKESLKVFFLVLQVCHLLMAGQVSLVLSLKLQNVLYFYLNEYMLINMIILQWMCARFGWKRNLF